MPGADVPPSGSLMVTQGGGAAVGSGHIAPQSSRFTRGGAVAVGCDLHGIVTGREPIELK